MDVQTMNSVDPVFKKEEVPMIIAQFWQQVGARRGRGVSGVVRWRHVLQWKAGA